MKILLDTNLLIPAALYENGVCAKAYNKAINDKNCIVVVCTHSMEEFLNSCNRKFSNKMSKIQLFLSNIFLKIKLIRTPSEKEKIPEEELIRDIDDRPILRAAVAANVDIIVTGDKDFLESGIKKPKILTPAEFINFDSGIEV